MHDAGIRLPLLLQPVSLRGIFARNRIVVSPMCQYYSMDGGPTDRHLVNLGKYAMGGAGIVFTEETAVEERGRKTYECAGIYSDDHVRAYRRITDFIRSQGALPAIQLGHAGRKASSDVPWKNFRPLDDSDAARGPKPWTGISASAIPDPRPGSSTPIAMSTSDIRDMIDVWRDAAVRSVDAGFDICEIHGAHGYLIHQFLSPLGNRRNDSYGGDLNGRMRFAFEITEAVRAVWPQDRPLFFRCSATDGPEGQWSVDDTIVLSRELLDRGVHVITCSSGGISGPINTAIVPRHPARTLFGSRASRSRDQDRCRRIDYRGPSCRTDTPRRPGGSDRACAGAALQPALACSCCQGIGNRELSRRSSICSFVVAQAPGRSAAINELSPST